MATAKTHEIWSPWRGGNLAGSGAWSTRSRYSRSQSAVENNEGSDCVLGGHGSARWARRSALPLNLASLEVKWACWLNGSSIPMALMPIANPR
jgi:hypothetical protein